jgi:hypothetical protein
MAGILLNRFVLTVEGRELAAKLLNANFPAANPTAAAASRGNSSQSGDSGNS